MSYFQCDDCRLTITYSELSPIEHRPHTVFQVNSDTCRTCCYICYQVVQAALAPSQTKSAIPILEILHRAYILAGGQVKQFDQWKTSRGGPTKACEYLQKQCKAAWRAAYLEITGQEWKP